LKRNALLIKNARIIDPAANVDETGSILIKDGVIQQTGNNITESAPQVIDATGLVACPGFIDLHCHLREPGFEEKETVASGAAAASRGGFTTICCMPNTNPPLDNAAVIDYVNNIAARHSSRITILPVGCLTRNREGKETTDMPELAGAGCAAFSDDGSPVSNSRIMALAMEKAAGTGLPVIDHCEDLELSRGGQMHDGWVAARLGLKGIPAMAEESVTARDIALAEMTGARLHITHVSTRGAVELIRIAKSKGLPVTADVTPHHLALTDERIAGNPLNPGEALAYDTLAKVNPPLRTAADIAALVRGINDGTIDAIATDHAPHTVEDKLCEFEMAAFGISGFETAFGVLMTLVREGKISLNTLIACMTSGPSRILINKFGRTGSIKVASIADIALLDLNREWTVDKGNFLSKGKNTPFDGYRLKGMVVATIHRGEIAYSHSPSADIKNREDKIA
jgi:dihydroorotase